MPDDILKEIRDRKDFARTGWQDIRKEAATDMQFVAGNPWSADDDKQRKGRPTIAPEEMGQYFNQVINHLWANPRGMKFAPVGNGANDDGARFYQNKAREIEYRSHAKIAYTTAASDAIQRSYGYMRIVAKYGNTRSANQELYIEAVPDPDMVTIDPEAKRPDSSDMQYAFVETWRDQSEFKRTHKTAKVHNFEEWAVSHPNWIAGNKVLEAEYWKIATRQRKLVLVQEAATPQPYGRLITSGQAPEPKTLQVFDDEVPPGAVFLQQLRDVQYPQVKMYLTNGLDILHEQNWPGKYIPIVSCYGKVLYVPKGGETKRVMLSMTRFGRDPWKALCYAASQQLEVISMIPKAPLMAAVGQFTPAQKADVQKSMHTPLALLEYNPVTAATGPNMLPPPGRVDYPAGQHIAALEEVKEGFRRAIQSAMASNFLPSQAQRRNEKSGVALESIKQAAATGTFHFVNNYEDMIRQCGVIMEDLIPHYYDFAGETGVIKPDGTAEMVPINTSAEGAISTKGDYLVTVSTGPSSDSDREVVQEFLEQQTSKIGELAGIVGPQVAAKVYAMTIKGHLNSPLGDQLAELISPPDPKGQDGKPLPPEVMQLRSENEQLKQVLRQAAMEKQCKIVEQQGKFQIAKMQEDAETQRAVQDNNVELAIAGLTDTVKRLQLLLETQNLQQDDLERTKDRVHDMNMADRQHQQALEQGEQGIGGQLAVNEQSAALAPKEGASA